jgi:flagellar basal body-associated protein FliL
MGLQHRGRRYTAWRRAGKKLVRPLRNREFSPVMSRSLVILIVVLLVVVGGLFFLAGRQTEKQPVQVEKAVSLENLQN